MSAQPSADAQFETVHAELLRIAHRELARHQIGATLETRALVNEAYLKLFDRGNPQFASREHLIHIGAQAMRQIIVDYARRRACQRHGGGIQGEPLEALETGRFALDDRAFEIVCMHEAMQQLGQLDPRLEKVAELRLFAGLEVEEVADVLGLSAATVKRDTRAALAFLQSTLA